MCLCVLILPTDINQDLIIVGNRDEAFERPTASLSCLDNGIYCGVDLVRGGTWLGICQRPAQSTRFAYLTNFTESKESLKPGTPSRGLLPMAWLTSDLDAEEFLLSQDFSSYSGMNLIIGVTHSHKEAEIYATSNRGFITQDHRFETCTWGAVGATYTARLRNEDHSLSPFVVALGNGSLGEPWVKVSRCEDGAKALRSFSDDALFDLMLDTTPCTQVIEVNNDVEDDKHSPIFISPEDFRGRIFGTRSTTIARITSDGEIFCRERNHIEGTDIALSSSQPIFIPSSTGILA